MGTSAREAVTLTNKPPAKELLQAYAPPLDAPVTGTSVYPVTARALDAGTGIGVLGSGPIAFALFDHWRFAWGWCAVIAAVTTTREVHEARQRRTGPS